MRIASLVAAVIFMGQAMPALAGNIKIGQLALNPYYGMTMSYDDNIYKVPANINHYAIAGGGVRGSMIMTNDLGLNLSLPIGEMQKVSLGYDLRSDIYKAVSSANNAISQTVNAGYEFKGSVTTAKFWENYVNTRDPQFNPNNNAIVGALVSRENRWANTMGVSAEYALGDKFFFGGDVQDTVNKYLERTLAAMLNHSETSFGVKSGYKIQPKTRVFTAIHRAITHYSVGPDASRGVNHASNHKDWNVDFGVEGQLTAKITGQVLTGITYRQMDIDTAAQKASSVRKITRNWSSSARINFKPTELCDFNLAVNRGLSDAVSGGNFYITTGLSMDASHLFAGKLKAGLKAGVQSDKYSEVQTLGGITTQRRDETYKYGLSADYKINDWASTGLAYEHNRRHSIFSRQYNYKQSLTSLNIKLSF